MFTGIIEEIGKISRVRSIAGGKSLFVSSKEILDDVKIGDSIAVNGVCLTVTNINETGFWADAVGATLEKTTLAFLSENTFVNLERSVRLMDRLGGHLVQGHVNGIGSISKITKPGENYFLEIILPDKLHKYVINEGSIAIDGISLTVAQIDNSGIILSIIPHTWNNTTLKTISIGTRVNIETDVIAKYVENLLGKHSEEKDDKYSNDWFKKMGYLK